jgi:hypothetical protein
MASTPLKRVLLQFPTDAQVRYVERLPARGQRMSGLRAEDYVVSQLERDGDGYHVICVHPHEVRDEEAEPRAGGTGETS